MADTAIEERFETADALGAAVAARIADGIVESARAGRRYLLGCPSGRTPRPIYAALGTRCAESRIDCSNVVIVMMDDYLQPDADADADADVDADTDADVDAGASGPMLVSADVHYSCRRFAEHEIRRVINRGLPPDFMIPAHSVWVPDPADPGGYDDRLAAAGGIDLFIVASGASDGHVAFCGPGSDPSAGTSIVTLAETTRTDNLATFPDFDSIDDVPTHGVSVGLGTISRLSRTVLLVLSGADKRESFRHVTGTSSFDPDWPATFIHGCPDARILTDALTRSEIDMTAGGEQ